jgi:hypothetical protein
MSDFFFEGPCYLNKEHPPATCRTELFGYEAVGFYLCTFDALNTLAGFINKYQIYIVTNIRWQP